MAKELPGPASLTVVIGGEAVGAVKVVKRGPRKVVGSFAPGPGFEPYRPVFEAAVTLDRQFNEAVGYGTRPCDDVLWKRLMDAYDAIKRLGPMFAEVPSAIAEFAVDEDWSVEVTFEEDSA